MPQFEIVKGANKTSTSSDYVVLPRLSQTEIDALVGVVTGSKIYNITTNREQIFNVLWINVAIASDITGTNSGTNTGDETTLSIQTKRPLKTIEGQSLEGSGNIDLSKSDVGLSNVDNTTDILKPISTATQTALNNKENTITGTTSSDFWSGAKTFINFALTVRNTILSGYSKVIGVISASDTVLQAIQKLDGNVSTSLQALTNQTAAIGTTTIFTATSVGLYRLTIYNSVNVVGNRNITSQTITHTENGVLRTKSVGGTLNTNNANTFSAIYPAFYMDLGTTLTYANTLSGANGSYNLYTVISKLT